MDVINWINKRLFRIKRMANKYSIFIRGENLEISIDGEICKLGFYTTRYIKANSELEAKRTAIKLITEEIKPIIKNNVNYPPTFIFENIMKIESFGDHEAPGSGFTWFEEDIQKE